MVQINSIVKGKDGLIYKVVKVFKDNHFDIQHTESTIDWMPNFLPTLYSEDIDDYIILNDSKNPVALAEG